MRDLVARVLFPEQYYVCQCTRVCICRTVAEGFVVVNTGLPKHGRRVSIESNNENTKCGYGLYIAVNNEK